MKSRSLKMSLRMEAGLPSLAQGWLVKTSLSTAHSFKDLTAKLVDIMAFIKSNQNNINVIEAEFGVFIPTKPITGFRIKLQKPSPHRVTPT